MKKAPPLLLQGFSLLEMMIVVAIIATLMTLAYPRLEQYLVSSRQTEAKLNLTAIYTAQKIFHASNLKYAETLNDLGVALAEDEAALYDYALEADTSSFIATATGNIDDDAPNDVWTIDENKNLINVENDVTH